MEEIWSDQPIVRIVVKELLMIKGLILIELLNADATNWQGANH